MTNDPTIGPTPDHAACLQILHAVWRRIDFEHMAASRRMGIYEEMQARMRSAAMCRDDQGLGLFLQRLCDRMGVAALTDQTIVPLLQGPRIPEWLRLFREEPVYLVLLLRAQLECQKAPRANTAETKSRSKKGGMRR